MRKNASEVGLRVMSGFAVRRAFEAGILADYQQRSGHSVHIEWAPTTVIAAKVAAGEHADILLITREAMDEMERSGIVDLSSRVEVATSRLGLAVARGAPHPEIGSIDAFKAALTAARSVAFSNAGASGAVFAALIEHLGIADAVRSRATLIPTGLTAETLVTGEADLAVQQISELLMVDGIEVVGPFPELGQTVLSFSAALTTAASNVEAAAGFLRFLQGDESRARLAASGLDPIEPGP
ncbi:molybdate ABC transporter substrate-binding protein [uncultured Enterovirga sp.]|uniref:molybdate ABC transporter substrate-binding protein n=1 Tax=uncultured Enterovirga sp. TaxID=2026352 RepID=UPI0035CAD6F0